MWAFARLDLGLSESEFRGISIGHWRALIKRHNRRNGVPEPMRNDELWKRIGFIHDTLKQGGIETELKG